MSVGVFCLNTVYVRLVRKLPNQWTWKFRTKLVPRKSITGFNIMMSPQIQDGGRPLIWKSLRGHISVHDEIWHMNQIVTAIK